MTGAHHISVASDQASDNLPSSSCGHGAIRLLLPPDSKMSACPRGMLGSSRWALERPASNMLLSQPDEPLRLLQSCSRLFLFRLSVFRTLHCFAFSPEPEPQAGAGGAVQTIAASHLVTSHLAQFPSILFCH